MVMKCKKQVHNISAKYKRLTKSFMHAGHSCGRQITKEA